MKKLNYFVIAMFATFAFSCSNDNETPPDSDAPTVTAPALTSLLVSEVANLDFVINAPGKVAEVSVAVTGGTAFIVDATTIVGKTTGTVTVTYTAPLTEGVQKVTLTVKDQQATPKSTSADASVSVTITPTSTSELLVAKFSSAPVFDGEIDDMWNTAQRLVSSAVVPSDLGNRMTYYNEDGIDEDLLDIFEAYEGEEYAFSLRSGQYGSDIYFLIEWEDADDSKDRQSWYFDDDAKRWKGEHKYANDATDKYYEDKFAFLFPIGEVTGFSSSTCYATCHSTDVITTAKDKHTRHYLKTEGQKIDMWHWKRVRGTYAGQVDDQRIYYVDETGEQGKSGSNGRGGDTGGGAGYSGNSIELTITGTATLVNVPKYVIPEQTDYYWIDQDQIDDGTALEITAVDADGILTYEGGTIDPSAGGYEQATGVKRIPSVTTKAFTDQRADIDVRYQHTGTGWICEVKRALNTGDPDDVVFTSTTELDFGFDVFNNAAIAHAIKPGLKLKCE